MHRGRQLEKDTKQLLFKHMGKPIKVRCVGFRIIEFMQMRNYTVSFYSEGKICRSFVVPSLNQFLTGITVKSIIEFQSIEKACIVI